MLEITIALVVIILGILVFWMFRTNILAQPDVQLYSEENPQVEQVLDQLETVLDKIEHELTYDEEEYPEEEKQIDRLLNHAEQSLNADNSRVITIQRELSYYMSSLNLNEEARWDKAEIHGVLAQLEKIFGVKL